ncbi:MAG: cupin domain-containing protein, partial [Sphingobacteriales bacterium]
MQLLAATMVGSAIAPGSVYAMEYLAEYDKFQARDAIYIEPNGGKKGKIGDSDVQFKFNKAQTEGHFGALELTIPPGILGAPPHSHAGFDEICRVLEGTIHVMVGDHIQEVPAGAWHLRPKGVVHT